MRPVREGGRDKSGPYATHIPQDGPAADRFPRGTFGWWGRVGREGWA